MAAAPDTAPPRLKLYAAANSDCSTRLRLALNLKGLSYEYIPSGTPHDSGSRPKDYHRMNPMGSLPTLVICHPDGTPDFPISQSLAALEYLDEIKMTPGHPAITSAAVRAHVRALALVIAGDTHPMTAPRIGRRLREQFLGDRRTEGEQREEILDWDGHFIMLGLMAYERMISAGPFPAMRYSVGDHISMADVCLLPQVWRARARGLDLSEMPNIQRAVANLELLEAVRKAHWDEQTE